MRAASSIAFGLCVVMVAACGRVGFDTAGDAITSTSRCDGPFGWNPPQRIAEVASFQDDSHPTITADNQMLVFSVGNSGMFTSIRQGAVWATPTKRDELDYANCAPFAPAMSFATTALYYDYFCPLTPAPSVQLWVAPILPGTFGAAQPIAGLESVEASAPSVSADELEMFYTLVTTDALYSVGHARRGSTADAWTDEFQATELLAGTATGFPNLARDGRTLFAQVLESSSGRAKIYVATRPAVGSPFGALEPVAELGDPTANDREPTLAWDCETIYFSSDRAGGAGGTDIYFATRAN